MFANKLVENSIWWHASKFIFEVSLAAITDIEMYKIVKRSAQLVKK